MTNSPTDLMPGISPEAERETQRLLDMVPLPVLVCVDRRVLRANIEAAECFGTLDIQSLIGRPLDSLVEPLGPEKERMRCVLHRLDGLRSIGTFSRSNPDSGESVLLLHDRFAGHETDQSLAMAIFAATDEAMLITDERQVILNVNPAFERLTGYRAEEAVGRTPHMLSSGRHDAHFYAKMWEKLLGTGHWHGEIWNRRKDGELYAQRITVSVVRDNGGQVVNYVAVFSDITSSKREDDHIRYMVNHDTLTHLPNRVLVQDRIKQALAQAARNGGQAALLFLDLDGFKQINDRRGHLVGDRVLEDVAGRLSGCVRESDTVARLGGDEFVILLPAVKSLNDAKQLAAKILAALSRPLDLDDGNLNVGGSIGIALYPGDGRDVEELLGASDEAMYRAKRQGGNRVAIAHHEVSHC